MELMELFVHGFEHIPVPLSFSLDLILSFYESWARNTKIGFEFAYWRSVEPLYIAAKD
jgi:hypothetical protein